MTPDRETKSALEALAVRLTKAQREALCVEGNTPMDDGARDKPGIARQLHSMGLTFIDLSPIGYELRAYLRARAATQPDNPENRKERGRGE